MRARRDLPGRRYLPWVPLLIAILVGVAALAGRGGAAARTHPDDLGRATHSGGRASALTPAQPALAAARTPVTVRASVLRAVHSPLPRSFLGLSFEYWDMPSFDSHADALRRVFGLLRVRGDGPVALRIGGDSADQSFWARPAGPALGPWPYHVTGRWLNTLASMVRSDHLRVLLDLNLVQGAPGAAARFARQAFRRLPHGSLMAFEIGNEPDIYHHWVDYHLTGRSALFATPRQWDQFSPGRYARVFGSYAEALHRVAPGVPLAGPESADPLRDLAWERRLLATDPGQVGMITVHRYPLTACGHPSSGDYSTIARMLSTRISGGLHTGLAPALRLADQAGLPLRLTELNSVTCEGRRGVSNSFASALWAPDALFSLWRAGLAGVNIHVRQGAANGAFEMTPTGLRARPLLYGLALFARTIGRQGELARLEVGQSSPSVRLWAVRSGRRLSVLALDKGPHPVHLVLRVPSRRPGQLERLLAPSVRAATGVTLAGQTLGPSGRWVGQRKVGRVSLGASGRYHVRLPAFSGALISFRL